MPSNLQYARLCNASLLYFEAIRKNVYANFLLSSAFSLIKKQAISLSSVNALSSSRLTSERFDVYSSASSTIAGRCLLFAL